MRGRTMTVRCPRCDTAYRVPPGSTLGAQATFRCSRCEHVFDLDESGEDALREDAEPEGTSDAEPPEGFPSTATPTDVETPDRRRKAVGRFALRTLVGVTLAFMLLSIYLFTHRGRVTGALAGIPLLGPELTARRLSPAHVQLTDVHGAYERVHGDALVFVVTGTAVNNAPVPVSAVEIQARINGAKEQRRMVFAGAAPHDVHDLSAHEIELLQTLRPPHDWRLLPGQDGDFLAAFVDPPVPLKEFSAEVVAVQRGERRGSGR
jgi:predicted Zn finger-like uncharacterized protein